MTTKTVDLTSQVNGVRTLFTCPEAYVPGTLNVHHNGLRLRPGTVGTNDFSEVSPDFDTFQWTTVATPPQVGDTLLIQYEDGEDGGGGGGGTTVVVSGIDPLS